MAADARSNNRRKCNNTAQQMLSKFGCPSSSQSSLSSLVGNDNETVPVMLSTQSGSKDLIVRGGITSAPTNTPTQHVLRPSGGQQSGESRRADERPLAQAAWPRTKRRSCPISDHGNNTTFHARAVQGRKRGEHRTIDRLDVGLNACVVDTGRSGKAEKASAQQGGKKAQRRREKEANDSLTVPAQRETANRDGEKSVKPSLANGTRARTCCFASRQPDEVPC